ncbi:MAG: 4'-phosphopantetheinyl transferase superfamily protein [Bacteroidales bacterium]
MVEVYAIKLIENDEFSRLKDHLLSLLPITSRAFYDNIKSQSVYQRSLLGELLARKAIGSKTGIKIADINIQKSEKGKPYQMNISNCYFNISHSGEWVVVGISEKETGIDVEHLKKINFGIAERFFSPAENQDLNLLTGTEKSSYFFELWTLKESYLKLLGKGLTKSLSSFSILKNGSSFNLWEGKQKISNVFFKQYFLADGYKLSICSMDNEFSEKLKTMTITDLF